MKNFRIAAALLHAKLEALSYGMLLTCDESSLIGAHKLDCVWYGQKTIAEYYWQGYRLIINCMGPASITLHTDKGDVNFCDLENAGAEAAKDSRFRDAVASDREFRRMRQAGKVEMHCRNYIHVSILSPKGETLDNFHVLESDVLGSICSVGAWYQLIQSAAYQQRNVKKKVYAYDYA